MLNFFNGDFLSMPLWCFVMLTDNALANCLGVFWHHQVPKDMFSEKEKETIKMILAVNPTVLLKLVMAWKLRNAICEYANVLNVFTERSVNMVIMLQPYVTSFAL